MANNSSNDGGCATILVGLVGIFMAVSVVIYIVEMIVRTVTYIVNAILAFFGNILIYLSMALITLGGAVVNLVLYLVAAFLAIAPTVLVSLLIYFWVRQIWVWCRHYHVPRSLSFSYVWLAAMGCGAIGLGYMIGYSTLLLWSAIGVALSPLIAVGSYGLAKKALSA